jgi:DNA replication protein DnaC
MSELETVRLQCKALRMPTATEVVADVVRQANQEEWSYASCLSALLEQELVGRENRRVQRMNKASRLPTGKTLASFDNQRLPLRVRRQLAELSSGGFVERAENLLFFGLPGTGKTHLAAAIGHELVQRGISVLFIPVFKLVGRLLHAKRNYELERELRRLDKFKVVIMDDIGYVQQSREEMEVLFTFLAERYERRSVMITSNLIFSEWGKIFKDPLTTAAAIDRVVHHSIIIEFPPTMTSIRAEEAARRNDIQLQKSSV